VAFTDEVFYGWRVARDVIRRKADDGTKRDLEEIVIELVKGDRHIEAVGQDGINPEIVLMRALSYALRDDMRVLRERGDDDMVAAFAHVLADHEARRAVIENGWIAQRVQGAVFQASVIESGAGG